MMAGRDLRFSTTAGCCLPGLRPSWVRFSRCAAALDERTRDKFAVSWYVQSGILWGRVFQASTEGWIDKDLGILDKRGGDLDKYSMNCR